MGSRNEGEVAARRDTKGVRAEFFFFIAWGAQPEGGLLKAFHPRRPSFVLLRSGQDFLIPFLCALLCYSSTLYRSIFITSRRSPRSHLRGRLLAERQRRNEVPDIRETLV